MSAISRGTYDNWGDLAKAAKAAKRLDLPFVITWDTEAIPGLLGGIFHRQLYQLWIFDAALPPELAELLNLGLNDEEEPDAEPQTDQG